MPRRRRERLPVDPIRFGEILREVRTERGMSQESLAYAMLNIWKERHPTGKISAAWVRQVESGRIKSVDRERIACAALALQVPVTRLLPPVENPASSATDVAIALRGYGLNDQEVERFLTQIHEIVKDRQLKMGPPLMGNEEESND